MTEEQLFLPFDDYELAAGAKKLRHDQRYADLMPPPKTLRWDWYMFRTLGILVAEARTSDVILPMLVGDIVRKFVPDTSPETRRLGTAYRDGIMYLFRRRKEFKHTRNKKRKQTEATENDTGQKRLL